MVQTGGLRPTRTTKEGYGLQYRIVGNSGMLREVFAEGEVEWDANGGPVRMFGTIQDITLRKQSEKQLALAARVFDNSIEGILLPTPMALSSQLIRPLPRSPDTVRKRSSVKNRVS